MGKVNASLDEIIYSLNEANSILVASHVSPDSDAYGSSLGLALTLRKLGKQVVCFNSDGASSRFQCIPAMDQIVDQLPSTTFDLTVVCDCGSANRLGDDVADKILASAKVLINIDHHISNSYFGKLNYVIGQASSTAEIIFDLCEKAGWAMDADIAAALLAGIYGDTGGFRYSSTSVETFRVAGRLIALGAVPHKIAGDLFSRKSVGAFRLQALVNSQAKFLADGQVVYAIVRDSDYQMTGTSSEITEGFVEGLRDVDGVKIACFIYWHDGLWKISLRSKTTDLNVSDLAQKFGGGGHAQAAAFRFKRSLDELLKEILPELEKTVLTHIR